jgi:hypothetical protein
MPRRTEQPRASVSAEIAIDLVTTVVLTLVFHYIFEMPWGLAALVAGPASILGWWCLLHLERNHSGDSWTSDIWD